MADLSAAIANAREALARMEHERRGTDDNAYMIACAKAADKLIRLLAALDAAQGEAMWQRASTVVQGAWIDTTAESAKRLEDDGIPVRCLYLAPQAPPAAIKEFAGFGAFGEPVYRQAPPAAVPAGYAAAIKAVQEMMPPRDFRPSAQVWLTGNQVNELHARLDAAAMLAAAPVQAPPAAVPAGVTLPHDFAQQIAKELRYLIDEVYGKDRRAYDSEIELVRRLEDMLAAAKERE